MQYNELSVQLCIFLLFVSIGETMSQGKKIPQETREYIFPYKATYQMAFKRDSLDDKEEKHIVYLSFNDSTSVFRSEERRSRDSTRYQYLFGKTKPTGGRISRLGESQEDNLIVKEKNRISTFENLSIVETNDVNYYLEEYKTDQNWEISNDTLTIHGFLCQKAMLVYGNREWIAWFTSEIPVSDGPYRFSGLPGLILRMEDLTKSWRFDLRTFEKDEHRIIVNFDEAVVYEKIDKRKFYEQKKYLLENIVNLRVSSATRLIGDVRVEHMQEAVSETRKKDNNWIELYP